MNFRMRGVDRRWESIVTEQGGTALLVKARSIAPEGSLRLGLGASDFRAVPLMPHVGRPTARPRAKGPGIAEPAPGGDVATWYHVHIADARVSPWDTAHAMRGDGLGI